MDCLSDELEDVAKLSRLSSNSELTERRDVGKNQSTLGLSLLINDKSESVTEAWYVP